MSHTSGTRQAQKEKTRQALLDAALALLAEQSLSSLGLREVTRAVGIAPTAFYRHFQSTAELGVALVDQALDSLHRTIATTLAAEPGDSTQRIAGAVELIAEYVRRHPAHVRFIARERHGGVQPVRAAIAGQLDLFAREVAVELAAHPESVGWSRDDLLMLAGLYVDQMVVTAAAFLDVPPDGHERLASLARRRMRLVNLGRHHWLD